MQSFKRIQLLLVEDHELVRMGIGGLIEGYPDIELIGEASSFSLALQLAALYLPDVILLDLQLEDGPAQDRIDELRLVSPESKILIFTANIDEATHLKIIRAGVAGLIFKNEYAVDLIKAIYKVMIGELWLNRKVASAVINNFRSGQSEHKDSALDILTPRQRSIANLASQGLPAKRIAHMLNISDKTVRNQLVVIYSKLGVSNQLELVAKAIPLGFVNNSKV